ncbi:hypothetical protein N7539_004147 [Penicillium diatomitis]|uniref:TATA element modulatory factor 1 TATA binding domain-containing protein n=1 Tax=Penicillium diatomitis TaxID=2819901 RepID=A0A9W9XDF5_9EURO|nr:uncharacterized protein N7539_004147 [Penicillium diatomitis]KAJ5489257.1 hypothetical protein N7539_004147 [Penicillium diatomitis]
MAQNPQAPKSKWGVGNFFQQAVAGVESRLDNILMDQEDGSKVTKPTTKEVESATPPIAKSSAGSISRSSSSARRNDRLQERLARAIVKSNTPSRHSQSSPALDSTPGSPVTTEDVRSSIDLDSSPSVAPRMSEDTKRPSLDVEGVLDSSDRPRASHESERFNRQSLEISGSEPRHSIEAQQRSGNPSLELSSSQRGTRQNGRVSGDSTRMSTDTSSETRASEEEPQSQWQQERYEYLARIDELQRNLGNMVEEAAKSAKSAAAAASPGSPAKELAESREKYALLMKEGQKLESEAANTRTVVRRLRQQLAENSRVQAELKRKNEKLEKDLTGMESRASRAEAAEKRAIESLSSHLKTTKQLEAVTIERDALNQTVREMKAQISRAVARAEAAEAQARSDFSKKEERRVEELEETLSSTKIELEICQAKSQKEIADLKSSLEKEKEGAQRLEIELKAEQSALESKMESLRVRAEEASSGAQGDTQAKLLRQIETLQTQYSVASENWHALESSYISRLDAAEKERDLIGDKEKDLRKRLREMVRSPMAPDDGHSWNLYTDSSLGFEKTLRVKELEEELEGCRETESELESQLHARSQDHEKVQEKLQTATNELASVKKEIIEQKKTSDANWAQKLEEERARWREQLSSLQQPRGISPVPSTRRSSNLDTIPSMLSDYRPGSRRSSTLPPGSPDIATPPRQNSYPASVTQGTLSPPPINTSLGFSSTILETPSITFEPDEFFGSGEPATPSAFGGTQTAASRGINDIISESTVGAGPSVQLVERMSATVRRLESERAGVKDELARVTAQRDEARKQVVDLMRELEDKKAADSRVKDLEAQLADIDQRYLTTLEMLGEKSEQVEELEADIADLKRIYRELVDSTMK